MISLLLYLILLLKSLHSCGSHDQLICKTSDASCSHQLHHLNAYCMVKFINNTDCPIYSVEKTYNPFEVPFVLKTYKDKKMHAVTLNLTFPNPKVEEITFHYKNEKKQKKHLCRSFRIGPSNVSLERQSLFWDCFMFDVSLVEGNTFLLELTDDRGNGGTYSLSIPTSDQQGENISKYHTFFYIHKDYFYNTGRLVATLQASPFPVLAYNVSVLSCLSNTNSCTDGIPIASYSILDSEFVDTGQTKVKTIDLGYVDAPGRYSVSVQMMSPDCLTNCAVAFSSIFDIPSNKVLQTIGILAVIFFFAATGCLAVLLKLKSKHSKYVRKVCSKPITVLFIYHPHNIEMYKLLSNLKTFLRKECFVNPMLVDDTIGVQNPNQWTEQKMISAAKVIFFLPVNHKAESATPIKKQYNYALNYFSGCNFPRKGDRFCYVRFADSEKPSETLYGLRSFSFVDDLPAIISWIHEESFIHSILYWRNITKNWPNYQVEVAPSTVSNYSELSNFNGILEETKPTESLLSAIDQLDRSNYISKISADFDHDIPDVHTIT